MEESLLKINKTLIEIADYLKRCNWNLGKIVASMNQDKELNKKLDENPIK